MSVLKYPAQQHGGYPCLMLWRKLVKAVQDGAFQRGKGCGMRDRIRTGVSDIDAHRWTDILRKCREAGFRKKSACEENATFIPNSLSVFDNSN